MVNLKNKPKSISENFISDMLYRVKFQRKWELLDQASGQLVFKCRGAKSILYITIVIGADGLIWVNLTIKARHKMLQKEMFETKELFFGSKLNAYQKIVKESDTGKPPNLKYTLWACLEGQQLPDFDVKD